MREHIRAAKLCWKTLWKIMCCIQWHAQITNRRRNPQWNSLRLYQASGSPFLNHSWKMNSHDRIYIAAPAVVSLAGCTAMLSITSYKFQLSPSSDKITHTHTYAHVSGAIHTQSTRQQEFFVSNKIILSLNLISTTSTVDKLHSCVIKADLAWFTRYGQDKINMIRLDKYWGQYFWRLGN